MAWYRTKGLYPISTGRGHVHMHMIINKLLTDSLINEIRIVYRFLCICAHLHLACVVHVRHCHKTTFGCCCACVLRSSGSPTAVWPYNLQFFHLNLSYVRMRALTYNSTSGLVGLVSGQEVLLLTAEDPLKPRDVSEVKCEKSVYLKDKEGKYLTRDAEQGDYYLRPNRSAATTFRIKYKHDSEGAYKDLAQFCVVKGKDFSRCPNLADFFDYVKIFGPNSTLIGVDSSKILRTVKGYKEYSFYLNPVGKYFNRLAR